MQIEQCGVCQTLEFDKNGNETHTDHNKYQHDFVPLDWCAKCGEPQFDSDGMRLIQANISQTRCLLQTMTLFQVQRQNIMKTERKEKKLPHMLV